MQAISSGVDGCSNRLRKVYVQPFVPSDLRRYGGSGPEALLPLDSFSVDEVQEFLDSLVKVATRDHKYFSSIDLRGMGNSMDETKSTLGTTAMAAINQQTNVHQTISAGVTRSMSMGSFHASQQNQDWLGNAATTGNSGIRNLSDFLHDIDEDDDDNFF